jgi:hypothetical protein
MCHKSKSNFETFEAFTFIMGSNNVAQRKSSPLHIIRTHNCIKQREMVCTLSNAHFLKRKLHSQFDSATNPKVGPTPNNHTK